MKKPIFTRLEKKAGLTTVGIMLLPFVVIGISWVVTSHFYDGWKAFGMALAYIGAVAVTCAVFAFVCVIICAICILSWEGIYPKVKSFYAKRETS